MRSRSRRAISNEVRVRATAATIFTALSAQYSADYWVLLPASKRVSCFNVRLFDVAVLVVVVLDRVLWFKLLLGHSSVLTHTRIHTHLYTIYCSWASLPIQNCNTLLLLLWLLLALRLYQLECISAPAGISKAFFYFCGTSFEGLFFRPFCIVN